MTIHGFINYLGRAEIRELLLDEDGFGQRGVESPGNAAAFAGLVQEGDFDAVDDHRRLTGRGSTLVVREVSVELFEGLIDGKIILVSFLCTTEHVLIDPRDGTNN